MSKKHFNVAAVSVNTTPLDWQGNREKIQEALYAATGYGAELVVFPELVISGYGCEDAFFTEDLADQAMASLHELDVPEDVAAVVGLPVRLNNRLFNGAAVITQERGTLKVHGIVLKQYLARNGVHYEPRWFQPWPAGERAMLNTGMGDPRYHGFKDSVPVGDLTFEIEGVRIGMELCEDAWVANRPGRSLYNQAVDVIVNPSASHFALGKHEIRQQFAREASRTFGCAYVYANLLGCESGRAIFDGGNFVASEGCIQSATRPLDYRDWNITLAEIDLQANRISQQWSSQDAYIDQRGHILVSKDSGIIRARPRQQDPVAEENPHDLVVRAITLGLRDWMKKTGTRGFTVSLSGGADSALVCACVHLMVWQAQEMARSYHLPVRELLGCPWLPEDSDDESTETLTRRLLRTVYQGTVNSSDTTLNAAQALADAIGASHTAWQVDDLVNSVVGKVGESLDRSLSWEQDDIALQNIQARVRAPGVWMLANIENKLLLATGNLSEMAMGYMTMDGDTCGVLAPISGLGKDRIRTILSYLETEGLRSLVSNNRMPIAALRCINEQQPTAELRPGVQTDEEDLMPYPVADFIRAQFLNQRRSPAGIYEQARDQFPDHDPDQLKAWVVRFFEMFARSRWKTDRSAPGFHLESDSLDSRTFSRFPLLSSGWKGELEALKA